MIGRLALDVSSSRVLLAAQAVRLNRQLNKRLSEGRGEVWPENNNGGNI